MKATIQLEKVCVGYRERKTMRQIAGPLSATLREGELTCLLGSNGVGKSTLLRTLSGYQPLLDGVVTLACDESEVSLGALRANELSRRVAVVLTSHPAVSQLTAEEVVAMGRLPYTGFWGKLAQKDKSIVAEALVQVGIEELAHRTVDTLSDGERQKVMIAKALAQETPIILLDEPTAFLDFPSKVEILQLLRRLAHAQQKTVLLSTHDLELALRLADVLWLMEKERGLQVGSPRTLADRGDLGHYIDRDNLGFDAADLTIRVNR